MKGTVHYEVRDNVALLTIENPPVNPLSSGVRQGLHDGFVKALADDTLDAIIVTGAGRAFIAGADITEFGKPLEGIDLHPLCAFMESSEKPIIAAINGLCLGGGFEVALVSDYRVAVPDALIGLPEIKIGVLPGCGGTQRLPRLIGPKDALDVMLSGDPMSATEAHGIGIADEIIEGDIVDGAVAYAQKIVGAGAATRKIRDESTRIEACRGNDEFFAEVRKKLPRKRRDRFAAEMIIQCVETGVNTDDFDAGLQFEFASFDKCFKHPQREALIHVFFSEREVARIPDVPKDTPVKTIEQAGIIGCGTMGGGIAMCFANVGIPVKVVEMDGEAMERGLGVIRNNYEIQAQRGRITKAGVEERMNLITGISDYNDLKDVDIVIEAIYENIDVKKEVFEKLDKVIKPGGVLASNTSGLDIDAIAAATSRPEDVIGTHFFSPANIMRLLEVVRGAKTNATTIATAMKLGKTLGKVAVLSGNAPSFIGNRMLNKYGYQAGEMVAQGASPYQVDRTMLAFGMPMGPYQMDDLVGLDLGWRARTLAGKEPESFPERFNDALCEMGRFGQKTSRGYYIYPEGSRTGEQDPEVLELAQSIARDMGFAATEFDSETILKRLWYAVVNEGARILDDGIAIRPCDIDIVYINGYGFPETEGGPMFWADRQGLDHVLADIKAFKETCGGEIWEPAPLLERLVAEGKAFSSLQGS